MNSLYIYSGLPALLAAMLWLASPASAGIELEGETAYYSGALGAGQNQRLFNAAKGKSFKRLVITSGGGEVEAGIALGLWIFEQHMNIEVREYCLSSCANYVFPAGRQKTVGAGAIVAWHGNYNHLKQTGLWQDDVTARMERHGEDRATAEVHVREEVDRLVRLEHDFFARIGVDEYLCWIGKMPPYNAPNYYFLSGQDMARFGVTHVQLPPDYENTDVAGFDDHIMYIRLDKTGERPF